MSEFTVYDAACRFIKEMIAGTVRRQNGMPYKVGTVKAYELTLRMDVIPHIGAIPVAALRTWDVQKLVDDLAENRTNDQACKAYGALRGVMRLSVFYKQRADNPCENVTLPIRNQRHKEYVMLGIRNPEDEKHVMVADNQGSSEYRHKTTLAIQARSAAVKILIAKHKFEYAALLADERTKRDLTSTPGMRKNHDKKIKFYEARIAWLKAQMAEEQM